MNHSIPQPTTLNQQETDRMAREGECVYEETIKSQVEPQLAGKYLAIDPESGDYFVGDTLIEAGEQARTKYPGKRFYIKRVGFKAVYHFHGVSGLRKEMFV